MSQPEVNRLPWLVSFERELATEPSSGERTLTLDLVFEQVLQNALRLLEQTHREEMRKAASEVASLAQLCLARTRNSSGDYHAWYGGQLQALSGMLRLALQRQLPLEIYALLSTKYAGSLLLALENGEKNSTGLASAVGINDRSQAFKVLEKLVHAKLVSTSKGAKERWFRLTGLGFLALSRFAEGISREGQKPHPASFAEVESQIERLKADNERLAREAQQKVAQLNERIKELNQRVLIAEGGGRSYLAGSAKRSS